VSRAAPTTGHTSTEPRCRPGNQGQASGEVCPEVAALCDRLGLDRPSKRQWLQRLYEKYTGRRDDFEGYVLTFVRHRGEVARSTPVDPMAERIAARLS